jgi:hypothetical protein
VKTSLAGEFGFVRLGVNLRGDLGGLALGGTGAAADLLAAASIINVPGRSRRPTLGGAIRPRDRTIEDRPGCLMSVEVSPSEPATIAIEPNGGLRLLVPPEQPRVVATEPRI